MVTLMDPNDPQEERVFLCSGGSSCPTCGTRSRLYPRATASK